MNLINIQFNPETLEEANPALRETAEHFCLAVLEHLEKKDWVVSILFCDDEYIRSLNYQFRGKDEPTDVLSFPLGEKLYEHNEAGEQPAADDLPTESYLAGDIVVSLETLPKNAAYFAVNAAEELRRLLIHGILHLDGMDHVGILPTGGLPTGAPPQSMGAILNADPAEEEPMLRLQEQILRELS